MYFTTIGAPTTKPQFGFADWNQDFPHPWDFMNLFARGAGSSLNYGYVSDPHWDSQVNTLCRRSPDDRGKPVAALDQYGVSKAYYAVFGHEAKPKFYSNRLNFHGRDLSVQYLTDLTSLQLK